MGWRSASHARWVTSSLVSAPGSVSCVQMRPQLSPEERWMTQSVEVIQFDTLLNSFLVILNAARLQKQILIQPVRKMCLLVFGVHVR